MEKNVSEILERIQHSVDAEQWQKVEHLILANHYILFSQGLHKRVSHWISLLPEKNRQSHQIKLQLAHALIPYQEERAFNIFCRIYDQAIDARKTDLAFAAWTGLADCCFYNLNRYRELKNWYVKANTLLKTESLPAKEKPRNAFIAAYFNTILFCAPDKKQLVEWQSLAQSALNSSSNPETRTLLSNHLILVAIWQGNMYQARLLRTEFLGDDSLLDQNPLAFMVQKTMQAQVAWLNADKEESLRHVKEGLKYSSISKIQSFDSQLSAQAVYACMVDNDFVGARKFLREIEKIKNPHRILDTAQYHYLMGWVAASTDEIEMAYTHAKRAVELTKIAGVEFAESATRTLLAQIHFEKNNMVRALHHLARVQWIGRRIGSLHIRYAGLLAQSWAMFHFKREKLALRYLRKAFSIGAKQNYLHIPGWPYKIMNHLCEIALNKNIESDYAKKLIRLHQIPPSDPLNAASNWPWKIQIKVFGIFRLILDGKEWKPSRKSQQRPLAILKLLAFHPEGIHQDRLADILWEDAEGDSVIQTMHTTLHRLRKLLNSHNAVTLHNGLLSLDPHLVHVDLSEFRNLAQRDLEKKKARSVSRQLNELYTQGLLCDETDSPWVIPLREKIRAVFLDYLYRNGKFMQLHGERVESIKTFKRAIELDNCTEKNYQELIELYIHEGLNAEAMQTYQECESALQKRFNISPSQKTRELISKL